MEFRPTALPGLIEIISPQLPDRRGGLTKIFEKESYDRAGIRMPCGEELYSVSHRNVIRGMHFQRPPQDHAKLVFCPAGHVLDVVVDLRTNSPTFRQSAAFELGASNGRILYIPSGFAHGFASLADHSIMIYNISSGHSPEHSGGIRWDSFGFAWPIAAPILSERDAAWMPLSEFHSPFSL